MINYNALLAFNLFGMILGGLLMALVIIADTQKSEGGYIRDTAPLAAPSYLKGNSGVSFIHERAA